jgi:uncharacterized protein (TIGR03083 family)
MDIRRHIDTLQADGRRLSAAAAAAGLDAPVPTCPGWAVRDLVRHLGGVHRWATWHIASGRSRETTGEEDARFFVEVADRELLEWFAAGHASLVRALAEADPSLDCWTFLPAPSPLAFWARRQAHETAIHRADAEAASGRPSACDAAFAVDGIDELLSGFLSRPHGGLVADPPVALGIRTSDTGHRWTIRIEAGRRVVTPRVSTADCTVRGAASDLYLLLWNRLPVDDAAVRIDGDHGVIDLWRERATIRWG